MRCLFRIRSTTMAYEPVQGHARFVSWELSRCQTYFFYLYDSRVRRRGSFEIRVQTKRPSRRPPHPRLRWRDGAMTTWAANGPLWLIEGIVGALNVEIDV